MPVTDEEFGVISEEPSTVKLSPQAYNELTKIKERAEVRSVGFIQPSFPECMDSSMPSSYQKLGDESVFMLYYESTYRSPHTVGGWVSQYIGTALSPRKICHEIGFHKTEQYRFGTKLERIGFNLKP